MSSHAYKSAGDHHRTRQNLVQALPSVRCMCTSVGLPPPNHLCSVPWPLPSSATSPALPIPTSPPGPPFYPPFSHRPLPTPLPLLPCCPPSSSREGPNVYGLRASVVSEMNLHMKISRARTPQTPQNLRRNKPNVYGLGHYSLLILDMRITRSIMPLITHTIEPLVAAA